MLLQLTVENVLSFRDRTVFSMMAAKHVKHDPRHVISTPKGDVLRIAALYGANASGKSNVVEALSWLKQLVMTGTRKDAKIEYEPFLLDRTSPGKASSALVELWIAGSQYSYGFSIDATRVHEEWLYQDGDLLFERADGTRKITEHLAPTAERADFIQFVAEGTRPNQLFLFEAADRNVTELERLYSWFGNPLTLLRQAPPLDNAFARFVATFPVLQGFGQKLLSGAGTGVSHIWFNHNSDEMTKLQARIQAGEDVDIDEWRRLVEAADEWELALAHSTPHGDQVPFHVDMESDGTKVLLGFAPVWYDLIKSPGSRIVIDELDRSLHPHLCRYLIEAFLDGGSSNGSQLIFTTHDTNLLDMSLLPPDSIWFVEKDESGASHMHSLAEYKSDQLEQLTEHVEEGYLQGRFGGIPFLGDPKRLSWDAKGE